MKVDFGADHPLGQAMQAIFSDIIADFNTEAVKQIGRQRSGRLIFELSKQLLVVLVVQLHQARAGGYHQQLL